MRNKKNFNNLFDSIITIIILIFCIFFYLTMMYFGVLHPNETTNPIVLFIIGTTLFVPIIIILLIITFKYCFEFWFLNDKIIYSKKLFQKRKIIYLNQIEKVEKKKIQAWVLGNYFSEAYIIYSAKNKIIVLINNRKRYHDLEKELKLLDNIKMKF